MTEDIDLRFVVVSDGHWGNNDHAEYDYKQTHQDALNQIDALHNEREVDFVVANGDIAHYEDNDDETDPSLHQAVIDDFFDQLPSGVDWYPVPGNHDYVDESTWQSVYDVDRDGYTATHNGYGAVMLGTSIVGSTDHDSTINPDPSLLESLIDEVETTKAVFGFQHVAPHTDAGGGNDMPNIRSQWERDVVDAVFCAHSHSQNDLIVYDGQRYFQVALIGNTSVDVTRGIRYFDVMDD